MSMLYFMFLECVMSELNLERAKYRYATI